MLKPLSFEGRFECGFDAIVKGKVCALVALYRGPGATFGLGIAVANEPGYYPIPLHWCHSDTQDEMQAHADALNAELLQLDAETAAKIVLSTMRGAR